MFPGWASELRGNRWHFAVRWSRVLPLTLVQPSQPAPRARLVTRPERRFENCEILDVAASRTPDDAVLDGVVQAGQILEHMRARSFSRPLLWLYNPRLVGAYAGVPAVLRVCHATENFFD